MAAWFAKSETKLNGQLRVWACGCGLPDGQVEAQTVMPRRQRSGFWILMAATQEFTMSPIQTMHRIKVRGRAVTSGCWSESWVSSFSLETNWDLLPEKAVTGRKLAAWTLTKRLSEPGSRRKRLCELPAEGCLDTADVGPGGACWALEDVGGQCPHCWPCEVPQPCGTPHRGPDVCRGWRDAAQGPSL